MSGPTMRTVPLAVPDAEDDFDLAEGQRVDLGRISVLDLVEQFVLAVDRLAGWVPVERQASGWRWRRGWCCCARG